MSEHITLEQQAEEAKLSASEYEDWIRQIGITKDPHAARTPEQIAMMQFRLERKQVLADEAARRAAGAERGAA